MDILYIFCTIVYGSASMLAFLIGERCCNRILMDIGIGLIGLPPVLYVIWTFLEHWH